MPGGGRDRLSRGDRVTQRVLAELGVGKVYECQGAIALQVGPEEGEVAVGMRLSLRPPAEREIRDQCEDFQLCLVVEAHPRRAWPGLVGSVERVLGTTGVFGFCSTWQYQ